MEEKLWKLWILFGLLFAGIFAFHSPAEAAVRDITLYDGDFPENGGEMDEEEPYVDEESLFLPGDTGIIRPYNNSSFSFYQIAKAEYSSNNSSVVQVDSNGNYKVLGAGNAIVSIKGWNTEGELIFEAGYSFLVGGDVSRTSLEKSTVKAYMFTQDYDSYEIDEIRIPFLKAPDLKYCSFSVEKKESNGWINCNLDKEKKAMVITGFGKGTVNLTIRLNRKQFNLQLKISEVNIKKNSAVMTPKGKLQLSLKGYTGKVKWVSTNKKVATVSQKGLVKAKKKTGNTLVYAQIGEHRMGCAISVISTKMKKVVNCAKKIARTCTYSQAKRMSSKYYDCSSLVWKSYHKIGKNFGDKNYAPVAANIAKWCVQKKKLVKGGVSRGNLSKMKLKPGDLVFLTGSNNHRYKGIYHVEMFIGYRCYGFSEKKPILAPCWAARGDGYATGEKLVARP